MELEDFTKIIIYPNTSFNQEYRIDKEGNVYSPYRGWHLVSKQEIKKGYLRVELMTNRGRKFFMIHRLVLETYSHREGSLQLQVNHKDGNKHNNKLNNLEWCTGLENIKHAYKHNLARKAKGEEVGSSKLTEQQVLEICKLIQSGTDSLTSIGQKYGVTKYCISDIKRKKSWGWLTKDYNFD
jgi:hypothetical protein